MEYIIEFIIDLTDKLYFKDYIQTNKEEQMISAKYIYLHGACYELAKMVKQLVPEAEICINQENNHCVIAYDGLLYDANGLVEEETDHYRLANEKEIGLMEKEFGTYFRMLQLSQTIAPKIVVMGPDQIIRDQIQKDMVNNNLERKVSHR